MKHAAVVLCPAQRGSDLVLSINHPRRGLEFPGGKIESGEAGYEAAIREALEETGWLIRRVEFLADSIYQGHDYLWHVTCFAALPHARISEGEALLSPAWRHSAAIKSAVASRPAWPLYERAFAVYEGREL